MKTTIDNISKQLKCVALIAALLLMGCNDAYDKTQSYTPSLSYRYLKPSKVVINLGSEAMSENVEIVSDGVEWNMVNSAPWLSVSPSSGNQTAQVTIAASRHLSGDTARMSIITL